MADPAFTIVCSSADRPAWLAARQSGIGASESAAVLGRGPAWMSALKLWAIKTGQVSEDELADVEAVFWGNELEPTIISGYGKRTGRVVVPFGLMLRSTRWPWLTATPDALITDNASDAALKNLSECLYYVRRALACGQSVTIGTRNDLCDLMAGWWPLQVKNIGFGSAEHWASGVPDYYRIQCAHEAIVCGTSRVTGAALIAGQRLAWDDIDVDLEGILERQIVNLTKRFMVEHVEANVAPAPDASESARKTLDALFPTAQSGKRVVLGADAMERAYNLEVAKKREKEATEAVKALENQIRADIGDAEAAVYPDGSAHTLKMQSRNGSTFRVLRRKAAREER